MKTPDLLDVPKSRPSRHDRIKVFKAKHGIVTEKCPHMKRAEHPWIACLMEPSRKMGYGVTEQSNIFDLIAKVGRLLDESGLLTTGETERDAIRRLAEANHIGNDF